MRRRPPRATRNDTLFPDTTVFLSLSGDDLAAVSAMFDQVLGQGVCIRSIEGLTYSDLSYQLAEVLRLPLRHRDGEQRLVIGCLSRVGDDPRHAMAGGPVPPQPTLRPDTDVSPRRARESCGVYEWTTVWKEEGDKGLE